MSGSVFLCLMSKVEKAFKEQGIKIIDCAGSKDGLMAHIDFEGSKYGLFILETTNLEDAMKEHLCHKIEVSDQN